MNVYPAFSLMARVLSVHVKLPSTGNIRGHRASRGSTSAGRDAAELPDGLSRDDALARFHVQTANGESGRRRGRVRPSCGPRSRASGAWEKSPGLRPVLWILERLYNLFLPLRPHLQTLGRVAGIRTFIAKHAEHLRRTGPGTGSSFHVLVTTRPFGRIPPRCGARLARLSCRPAGPSACRAVTPTQ